jgi:hypothetical protein
VMLVMTGSAYPPATSVARGRLKIALPAVLSQLVKMRLEWA